MRDLSFCTRHLEAECQKIEAHDERFIHIADLAQAGRYSEAADEVASLLAANLYDVRLVGYALFAAFHEDSPARLRDVLEHTATFLTHNIATIAGAGDGADARTNVVDRCLTWLFRSMADALEYQQAQKAPSFTQWTAGLAREEIAATMAAARSVSNLLPSPAFQASGSQLTRILQLARGLEGAVAAASGTGAHGAARPATGGASSPAPSATGTRPPSSSASSTSPPRDASDAAEPSMNGHDPTAAPDAHATTPPAQLPAHPSTHGPATRGTTVQLRATARFMELCDKLRAFETLVKRGEFEKAAVVSSDIMHAVEHFDPRAYFPELFAGFGALLSAHIDQIGPRWDGKDTLEWRALEQYYQVDLASFVGHEP